MRSIGKGIFNAEARNKENRKRLERTQPASNIHSWPSEKRLNGKRERRKCAGEKRERVSTSFQTYLRSVKYTVKNIRF